MRRPSGATFFAVSGERLGPIHVDSCDERSKETVGNRIVALTVGERGEREHSVVESNAGSLSRGIEDSSRRHRAGPRRRAAVEMGLAVAGVAILARRGNAGS